MCSLRYSSPTTIFTESQPCCISQSIDYAGVSEAAGLPAQAECHSVLRLLQMENVGYYAWPVRVVRRANSRSQPCAKVRSSSVSPLLSVSDGKSAGRRSVPILQLR